MLVPVAPMVGVKPVMVGGPETSSASCWALVACPDGEDTKIEPLIVPVAGTLTTSWVAVAETTVACVPPEPPKRTVFCPGVALNPAP
jgi:hypothetical protein